MTTAEQVRILMKQIRKGTPAAAKTGMGQPMARKYPGRGRRCRASRGRIARGRTRSRRPSRRWSAGWSAARACRRGRCSTSYSGSGRGQLRTLQRRFREWKARRGPERCCFSLRSTGGFSDYSCGRAVFSNRSAIAGSGGLTVTKRRRSPVSLCGRAGSGACSRAKPRHGPSGRGAVVGRLAVDSCRESTARPLRRPSRSSSGPAPRAARTAAWACLQHLSHGPPNRTSQLGSNTRATLTPRPASKTC